MKKIVLFISILAISLSSFAQGGQGGGRGQGQNMPKNGIIKGLVIDSQTKKPVPFATVAIFSKRDSSVVDGVMTSEDGTFIFENLKYGKYYLTANFIGYYKETLNEIKVYPKQITYDCGIIKLKQGDRDIDGVEVVGEASAIQYKIDRKVINVSKNINASGGTLVDVLESTPSMNVDIDGNVTMRGSSNFTVLIDGKPSVLDANDILNQIPASTVETIEIITNPSAKFDPDGTAGIINVITKKKQLSGFSGIVNVSYGTGDKHSADFLFNYKTKKINFFVGADYGKRTHNGEGKFLRETYLTESTQFLSTATEMSHGREGYSGKIGFDYYIAKNTTLTLSGKYGHFEYARNMYSDNHIYSSPTTIDEYSRTEGLFGVSGPYYSGTFDLKHNFANKKGHNVSATVDYSFRDGGQVNNNSETPVDADGNIIANGNLVKTFQDRSRVRWRISADYELPLKNDNKFEAGIQNRIMSAGGDYIYDEFDYDSDNWITNTDFSNEMTFIRNIYGAYSTYTGKVLGIGYKAGIRGEYTYRIIEQHTTNEEFSINRPDYFPSLHLSKELPKDQQILASYSKRIRRPRHWYLNPYPSYSDSYYYRVGNPDLGAEYVDSYELNYQKTFSKTFFTIELYYRKTNDAITQTQTLQDNNVMLLTFENLDKTYAYGTEISVNTPITKWWKVFANANFYQYYIQSNTEGLIDGNSTNYDFRVNSTFMFSKTSRLQINGMYNAPTVTAQGTREGFYMFDFAYRQEFFKRKLSMVFKVRDPFQTAKYVTTYEGESFYSINEYYREAPVFTISLSYKINNFKPERKSRNGEDEEGAM